MAIFRRKQRDDDIVDITCYGSTIPSQNVGGFIVDNYSGNIGIGYDMGDRPTGTYNDLIPQRLYPGAWITVNPVKSTADKHCAYCGNVNAPDARKCCGCQHAI